MDDDGHLTEIIITHGINHPTGAGSIGGVSAYLDDDDRPTVLLAPGLKDGTSTRVELHEGDTFELGPELWEVTEIEKPDKRSWSTVLNRLR